MAEWLQLWNQIEWLQPQWLYFIVLLPLLMIWQQRYPSGRDDINALQQGQQRRVRHSLITQMRQEEVAKTDEMMSSRAVQEQRLSPSGLMQGLRWLILSALLVALAQPQLPLPPEPKPQQKTVRDVLFVVESSASFLLEDYQVDGENRSRMEAVKSVLDRFISGLSGNRFAITVYAKEAFNLMPLSSDQTGARLYLQRLRPYLAGRTDEGMGEALGLALKQTQQRSSLALQSAMAVEPTQRQVLILISDGDNQPSRLPLESALRYAQLLQVPIYTIGVGAESEQSDQRAFTGLIYQPLKEESLQQIAQATNGRYFRVGNRAQLNQVLAEIDQLEGVDYQEVEQRLRWQPLYIYALQFGFGLWVLYLVALWQRSRQREQEVA